MKRIVLISLLCALLCSLTGCSKKSEVASLLVTPQISQMRAICELATMECYYHNVAKVNEKEAEKGWFFGLGTKDMNFWIEYCGVVQVGIDVSQVQISVNDNIVTIKMPASKVLGSWVDPSSLSAESVIVADGSAKVTSDAQVKAVENAQKLMEEDASTNSALLYSADERARQLLEGYVKNISKATGVEYTINWENVLVPVTETAVPGT